MWRSALRQNRSPAAAKSAAFFDCSCMRVYLYFFIIAVLAALPAAAPQAGAEGAFRYHAVPAECRTAAAADLIGFRQSHVIGEKETLLDIARNYGLGFNELRCLYPDMDPWLPPPGRSLEIPQTWVLPPARHAAVVINLPEMRLYRFFPQYHMVKTYPVGIGRRGWETPPADTRVSAMIPDPVWTVPGGFRRGAARALVPPGPDNPLGAYWIGLEIGGIGIHSTNFPWGVGRMVSHGCIRMYPEHMESFFAEVSAGTPVEIIYEPVKAGLEKGSIFVEVHPDIYGRIGNMRRHTEALLESKGLLAGTDRSRLQDALVRKQGVPVAVGRITSNRTKTEKGGRQ